MKKKSFLMLCIIMVLAACMLSLAGCGGGGDDMQTGYIYLPEYISLPDEIEYMERAFYHDGTIYFTSYGKTGERTPGEGEPQPGDENYYEGMYDIYGSQLYKINIDGSNFGKLENYVMPQIAADKQGYVNTNGMTMDAEGNIWVLESYSYEHTDSDGNWVNDGSEIHLRQLDNTGAEVNKFDISQLAEGKDYFYLNNLIVGQDGYIYTSDGETALYAIDKTNGQVAFTLEVENWINSINTLADGRVVATSYEGSGMVMKPVDSTAKAWGQNIELSSRINTIYDGFGNYDFYYTDNSNLYGYKISGNVEEKLINWIDSDMGNGINNLFALDDERFLCLAYNYDDGGQDIVVLTKTDRSQITPKTTLTLACLYMDYNVRSQVIKFNKTNSEYRIQVKDYSEYNTDDNYEAGLMKLNTEILSGQVPDILYVDSSLPVKQYAAKGLLEDLYTYIDADKELGGRDALITSYFDVIAVGDMLPYISSSFSIITAAGATRVVGEEPGWTIDELNAVLAEMPDGCTAFPYLSQTDMLSAMSYVNLDEYVDWSTGECHFDSEEFIKILEFCKTFPTNIDWENWENMPTEDELLKNGMALLSRVYLSDFQTIGSQKSYFGEDITFKGFPSGSSIGSAFSTEGGLAISSKCAHKDVAWGFIRYMLTEDYQEENSWYGFPTNKAIFDKNVDEALHPDEDNTSGGGVIMYSSGSDVIDLSQIKVTQEDVDKVMYIIENTENTMSYDSSILNIITEETSAFFAGQKSAADTAKIIQDRVRTYVSEQS